MAILFLNQDVTGDSVLDVFDRLFYGLPQADAAGQTNGLYCFRIIRFENSTLNVDISRCL